MIELEDANRARDRRLRRRLLQVIHNARISPKRGINGRAIRDTIDACSLPGKRFDNDDHCLSLLRDLVTKALITETDLRMRPKYQPFGLDALFYSINATGVALLNETAPRDADIEDERDPE